MQNNEAMQKFLNSQNGGSVKQESDNVATQSEKECLTVKYRDFQQNMKKYKGKTFKVVDGEGQVIFFVYSHEQIQNSLELPENFSENFMAMYGMIESVKSFVDNHSN